MAHFTWFILLAAVLWVASVCTLGKAVLLSYLAWVAAGGWRYLKVVYRTMGRDLRGFIAWEKVALLLARAKADDLTVPMIFQEQLRKYPNKACFLFEDQVWTFQQVEDYSNQVANCFLELGFLPGQNVALFMESRPEYVCLWLGLSKIGVVSALINTNQRLEPLVHSVKIANCEALIYSNMLLEAVKEASHKLEEHKKLRYYCFGQFDPSNFQAKPLDALIRDASTRPPVFASGFRGGFNDKLIYIYTSGTTGLPKAAIIKHNRFMWIGAGTHYVLDVRHADTVYCSLPLYHTAGGIVAVSQALMRGSTVVIRQKFSASQFWPDCIKYHCTVANYIGETCRYLLAQPERPTDKQHSIRMMFGNGLRPQIWGEFVRRFNIPQIGEFYGSTEGNANTINLNNKQGAIGFLSLIAKDFYPITLIKVDPVTSEPLRDKRGMCIPCPPGEMGEIVGKIKQRDPVHSFDGYVSKSATKKKIVTNVRHRGDAFFRSGDVLYMDEDGYLFFRDRTGDTFRWRGENVSTAEVEGVISKVLQLSDCAVYGVEIPGVEGKAGMAAIKDPERKIDLDNLAKGIFKALPAYAVPIFIRLVSELETTGTYKIRKVDIQNQAFDIKTVKDPMFYLDAKKGTYLPLDSDAHERIVTGKLRL